MRVLALDLGESTGWYATGLGGGVHRWSGRPANMHITERHKRRFGRFGAWLADTIIEIKPAVLVIEEMVGRRLKGEAARSLLGLRGTALHIAYLHEVLTYELNASTWQPWARAHGWSKADDADAKAMHDYFQSEVAERVITCEAA